MQQLNNLEYQLPSVLPAYGLDESSLRIESFGGGLINRTWKVTTDESEYILQRVNDEVFKKPDHIAHNIRLIADYLQQHHPDYRFVAPLATQEGLELVHLSREGFFRLFPFVAGSHTRDVVDTPQQAFEAASQFGKFSRLLAGFDASQLKITIPRFHDLPMRFEQFTEAIEKGNPLRIRHSGDMIRKLLRHRNIVEYYSGILSDPDFRIRVTHHDTKISNVLFDEKGKGLCVIDLDTVMPGYFLSDVGDMFRTYLCPVSEEEKDFGKILVRDEFYVAIVQGYYHEMKDVLTEKEKRHFLFGGKCMIYMQALRFLSDYLQDDVYYGAQYEDHNFVRAGNQLCLLEALVQKQSRLNNMIQW